MSKPSKTKPIEQTTVRVDKSIRVVITRPVLEYFGVSTFTGLVRLLLTRAIQEYLGGGHDRRIL